MIEWTDHEKAMKEMGYLDDRGLTVFDTLHEMQVRSCAVYEKRNLFGTYSNETERFEWMSFKEYADKVDRCRTVLKDLGASLKNIMTGFD